MRSSALAPTFGRLGMLKSAIAVSCLTLSYFIIVWVFSGYWAKALMTGILASLVFSTTLFAAGVVAQGRPWRAFWIANGVLILIFGGIELYGLFTLKDNPATRFGGARLSVDGQITAPGVASLAFDMSIGTLANFLDFYLSRTFIRRFVE